MKEHPIIFSGAMVRAILDGRKTQTRRVVKNIDESDIIRRTPFAESGYETTHGRSIVCPYGVPGDQLWVRETWAMSGYNRVEYRAFPADGTDFRCVMGWRPSIHMPRKYSRILLEVTGVRVERLQEITVEDALAEGISEHDIQRISKRNRKLPGDLLIFSNLWDSINAKRGYGWDTNPFVWCVTFKRI